jgi:phosphoribosylglycinamide formyltransferase-1
VLESAQKMPDETTPSERFVSEPIVPIGGSFATSAMATGEPGLPMRFQWRGAEYEVARIIEKWKTTGECRSGSDERYVRKHWYRIATTDGTEMKIYFERQPRPGRDKKRRWWLATVSREESKEHKPDRPSAVDGSE